MRSPPFWEGPVRFVRQHLVRFLVAFAAGTAALVVGTLIVVRLEIIPGSGSKATPTVSPAATSTPGKPCASPTVSPSDTPPAEPSPPPTEGPASEALSCAERRVQLPAFMKGEVLVLTNGIYPLLDSADRLANINIVLHAGTQMSVIDSEIRFDEKTCDAFLDVVAQTVGDSDATEHRGWIPVEEANLSPGGCRSSGAYRAGDRISTTDKDVRLRLEPSSQDVLPDGTENPYAQLDYAGQRELLVVDPGPRAESPLRPVPFMRVVVLDEQGQPADELFNPYAPESHRVVKQPRDGLWAYQLYMSCAPP